MLKILERNITLQLLAFYLMFLLPLVLGGMELYFFQRDTVQQHAQQSDMELAQAVAFDVEAHIRAGTDEESDLVNTQEARQLDLHQLTSAFMQASRSNPDVSSYIICDPSGKVLLTYPLSQQMIGEKLSGHTYFQQALKSNVPVISSDGFVNRAPTNGIPSASTIALASRMTNNGRVVGVMVTNLSLEPLSAQFMSIQQRFSSDSETNIWLVDANERAFVGTGQQLNALSGLTPSLKEISNSLVVRVQDRDWLYSFVSVEGTPLKVVVGRPVDVILNPVISFQHSLIIALVVLLIGASLFWLSMHGWVIAPLSRLAQAVALIRPDQTAKVTDSKLIVRERNRIDEIGQLIAAVSAMENEMHDLFRKSDEKSQARLHTLDAIMQSMTEGVLLESPQGEIVYANRSFTQFVGISSQDILLDSFDENHLSEKLLAMMENSEGYQEALRQTEQAGGPQVVTFQVRGYYNQVGQLVPVRRDIRMQHFEVRDLADQLIGRGKIFNDETMQNEAEQMKKKLLAIVSHELRTPLTTIKGYATSLLETDVELDPAVQERFLMRIVEEGDRMADLVTNLLEMSQLEAGTLRLSPTLCHLDALLYPIVADEPPNILVHIPDDMPLLYVDRRRIEMVLRNLIENARRYAGPEAVIEIAADYQQEQADAGLHLTVTDDGPGLPPHLTERIFDHFYQVDGSRERSSGGVGLGLAICRGFVEAHGGRIWADNRADDKTGAVFHIWLPAKVVRNSSSPFSLQTGLELHNAL
jgi:signal transduction histidine kinase/HAMP domain-containing protein